MSQPAHRAKKLGIFALVVFSVGAAFALSGLSGSKYEIFTVVGTPQAVRSDQDVSSTFTARETGHYWPELLLADAPAKTTPFSKSIAKDDEDTAAKIVAQAASWQVTSGAGQVPITVWRHYFFDSEYPKTVDYAVGAFPAVRGEQYVVKVSPLSGMRKLAPLHPRLAVMPDPLEVKDQWVWASLRFLFGLFLALIGLGLLISFLIARRRSLALAG